ncbi:uncharacterized protein [Nicotiana sylvestris]|uniref:uncharacterized protein n=1 Tax=Nicotiana sylvestris TaxID=4096 RepID=UPI00388CE08F
MDMKRMQTAYEYIEDTNAIVPLVFSAATFKVEHGLILMLKAEGFFRNSTDDDPTQHLRKFLGVCAMHKQNNISDDDLRLRVFKYSLDGDARKWLQNMPHSIHSWPELVRAFLAKWFPQSKKSELRDKSFFFSQVPGEHLHEAWDRFKLYLVRSPNHGFLDPIFFEKFYMGLDPMNQSIAKNAADESFMEKSFARMQMRDLSREQNPKQKGTLPSDTIANPKGSRGDPTSHVMAITTRSGKIEEPSVVEVETVSEELKVQSENREEVKEKVKETPKTLPPIPRPLPPFPQRLARKVDDRKLKKLYDILKQLSVNIPFVEAFQEMSGFAKDLKDLITKKRTTKNEVVNVTHRALCDNGASINLMHLAIYKQAGLGMPRPTSMRLQMADRSIKRPVVIVEDVLVKVGKFHLPTDFVILDCAVDKEIPIILGRPFLAIGKALMDSERNEIKFRVNDEEVTFQASKGMKLPHEYESISVIDVVDEVEDAVEMKMEEQCLGEALAVILVNFDGEDMERYMESVNALEGLGSYTYAPAKLSLDLENRATPPAKPSIIEPPQLELKPLPPHLRHKFIGSNVLHLTFSYVKISFSVNQHRLGDEIIMTLTYLRYL